MMLPFLKRLCHLVENCNKSPCVSLHLFSLFQTSVQFGFQRSFPEAPLVPHHLHDDEDDHRVSAQKLGGGGAILD